MNGTYATEIINVTRDVTWLPWAVQYFFLIGISTSAFFLAVPGLILNLARWHGLSRVALFVALTTGLAAPVALLADLHQPFRFYFFYLHFTPWSWMSWGSLFLPAYVGGLLVFYWLLSRPVFAEKARQGGRLALPYRLLAAGAWSGAPLRHAVGLLTLAAAALVALYTGMEVMVVKARPLWDTPLLPVQFVLTGLVGAAGLVLLLNVVLGDGDRALEVRTNRLLALFLGGVMLAGALWFALAMTGVSAVHAAALATISASPEWRLTAVWAVLATILPLAVAWLQPAGTGWFTGLAALHSAWMFRWTVFIGGQTVPKTGAGLYEYALPVGPEGWLGIAGTAGLWLFLVIVFDHLTPLGSWARAPGRAGAASPLLQAKES